MGYTERVADFYAVTWRALMRSVLHVEPSRTAWMRLERTAGVAITSPTADRVAHYFRLSPLEVLDMHLSRFHGSALDIPPHLEKGFDPVAVSNTAPPRVKLRDIGMLRPQDWAGACHECLREHPARWRLSWRLRWHIACTRHGTFIVDSAGSPVQTVDPAVAEAQILLLERLRPSAENQRFFENLRTVVRNHFVTTGKTRPPASHREFTTEALAAILPGAVDQALKAAAHAPRPIAALRPERKTLAERLDELIPLHRPQEATTLARLPILMPMRWYVPDLSDLSYPVPIRAGRGFAAAAVYLVAGGSITALTTRPGSRPQIGSVLARMLRTLEEEGRLELYWAAINAAAEGVLDEDIDYLARSRAASNPETYARALSVVPARGQDRSVLRTWLVDQWACAMTTTPNPRPSVRSGRIEVFDREHGATLTRVLDTLASPRVVAAEGG